MSEQKTTLTTFQFRLNGLIITHLKLRPALSREDWNRWQLIACNDRLGEFAIDDNESLSDPALPQFILELRDATIPPMERRYLPNKGWRQVTTKECFALLKSAGVIDRS